MRCFRCNKNINKKDGYYSFTEYSKGIKIKIDYAHKECWDRFISQIDGATNSLNKSNYLLNAMSNHMRKIGMIPDEVVTI